MTADLSVTAIDVGFDLRLHAIEVELRSDVRSVMFDHGGETHRIESSSPQYLAERLRKAGYDVRVVWVESSR